MLHFQSEQTLLAIDKHHLSQNALAMMFCNSGPPFLGLHQVFVDASLMPFFKIAAWIRDSRLPLDGASENLCKENCKGPYEKKPKPNPPNQKKTPSWCVISTWSRPGSDHGAFWKKHRGLQTLGFLHWGLSCTKEKRVLILQGRGSRSGVFVKLAFFCSA